jgi:glyoxylase-like metal-dependent hydrolase (beta-lactamase superfamily II)
LQQLYDTPVFMHAADEKTMKASNFMLMALGLTERMAMPRVQFIGDGFAMEIGQKLRYVAAPGHTPGSCLICWGRTIFSGDTIYAQGVGLSGLPGEDKEQLRHSILRCWDLFPLESTLCPGHGRSTTFAQMRAGNSELRTFLGLESASKGELLPCALPAVSP